MLKFANKTPMPALPLYGNFKVGDVMNKIVSILSPRYGESEAKAMSRLIFYSLKGWNLTDIVIHHDSEVSEYILNKINGILERLAKDEPIQYVLGDARFYGMNLHVDRNVLIPRKETEELVDLIVKENSATDLKVLDVGTGSGAIAIALARNLKFPQITALDISEEALKVARRNAQDLHAKIDFKREDIFLYEPVPGSFNIIVSNPPYVCESEKKDMHSNVLNYEPSIALFVPDTNPLIYYSRIIEIGTVSLIRGGKLYFEINPLYAGNLYDLLKTAGYDDIKIIEDISGKKRIAAATIS